MKLILNIYDYGVVMHVKFHQVSPLIEELLPFDCLNFNVFLLVSHNFVSNRWNFMKLILIYMTIVWLCT